MPEINKKAKAYELFGENEVGIVLTHGFTASPAITRPLGEDLNKKGYHVFAPLLPGHGSSEEDLKNGNAKTWLDEVASAIEHVKKSGKKRIVCIGHSLGGVISLLAAENGFCDGVITVAAPMRLYGGWKSHFFSWFFKDRFYDLKKPKESDIFRYYRADGRSVGNLLHAMKTAENGLKRIDIPVFVIYSRDDKTVKPKSAQIIYDGISSKHKELLEVGGSHHECIVSSRKEYMEKITAFIDSIE